MSWTDKQDFCEQIRACEGTMYALALSIVKNEGDAGEVLSEAVYRSFKHLSTLKNEAQFKPWVLRIVRNTAIDLIRQNTRLIPIDPLTDTVETEVECNVTAKLALREAVSQLKQPYRTVVVLFYFEDLSIADIAHITAANPAAVKKQLSRARQMLRELLKEDLI